MKNNLYTVQHAVYIAIKIGKIICVLSQPTHIFVISGFTVLNIYIYDQTAGLNWLTFFLCPGDKIG